MTKTVNLIAQQIANINGRAYFVGGYVRDKILNLPSKDIDIEVFGVSKDNLIDILKRYGKVNMVGASFGVIKLTTLNNDYDFSLPRSESKAGNGHKGFIIEENQNMSLFEAAKRRDFTFNSISQDILTGEIIDHFNGIDDIKDKIINHTSNHFPEDPVRVLRAIQFAAGFDFILSEETANMCKDIKSEFQYLPKERIWIEFEKLFTRSIKPSRGIEVLQQTEWIEFFPEIAQMDGLKQDQVWHPEGDVLQHTKHVMDETIKISNPGNRLVMVLAALCHDMGKITTTEFIDGKIRSRKHAIEGVKIAKRFMDSINTPNVVKNKVLELVREHMVHTNTVNKRTVRRLLSRLNYCSIDELMIIIEADHSGRPPLKKGLPENAKKIKEIANEMGDIIKPIIMGRHLIELGMKPDKQFGEILNKAFEAQLDGQFENLEKGIEWIKKLLKNNH